MAEDSSTTAGTKTGSDTPSPPPPATREDLDRDMVRLTRAMVFWTGGLFLGAVMAAGIAFFQLKAMEGQLREMQSSSNDTHILSTSTQQLASETKRQAKAIDNLRKAGEAQARAMQELHKAGELQAKASRELAAAASRQAFSTQNLVQLTARLADATSDQSKASQTMAELELERSQPRLEVRTTAEAAPGTETGFFPSTFEVKPVSGVSRINVAIAHEVMTIHDRYELCTVVLDNFFVWNTSSSDFRTSHAADIFRNTMTKAGQDGLSLQHLFVDLTVEYETLNGRREKQLLRFALGRAEPSQKISTAMEDPWPHLVLGTLGSSKRALLGFETGKPLDEGCSKASADLDRYPSLAMTTAWAIGEKGFIPIGEVKGEPPTVAILRDPKAEADNGK